LNISGTGAFLPLLPVTMANVITTFRVRLAALSFPIRAIILTGSLLLLYNRGWLKYYAELYRRVFSNRT
jgi:hypothetical protein